MTIRFSGAASAFEELEALEAAIPNELDPMTADMIAAERSAESRVVFVQVPVPSERDPGLHRRKTLDESKLLLTQTAAARALGVDRRSTLADLIANKAIDVVPGPRGRVRVPRSEVLRLVQEGVVSRPGARRRRSPRNRRPLPSADEVAAEIAAIKID